MNKDIVEETGVGLESRYNFMLSHIYDSGMVYRRGIERKSEAYSHYNGCIGWIPKVLKTPIKKVTVFKISMFPHPKNPDK